MEYDPNVQYTASDFRGVSPKELHTLFEEAKKASHVVRGLKLIRKVTKDVSSIRLLLNGFDGIYNGDHK